MDMKRVGYQPYRYCTSKLIFLSSSGEFFAGTALLVYWMRSVERQMGSKKFVLFVAVVNLIAILLEFMAYYIWFFNHPYLSWRYAGPYPLLGALFLCFHLHAPRMHPRFVQALGMNFSEKTVGYLSFSVIALAQRYHTLAASVEGMLAWMIYRHYVERIVTIPGWFNRVSSVLGNLVEPPPPLLALMTSTPGQAMGPRPPPSAFHPISNNLRPSIPATPPQPPTPVDPVAVEQLMSMGFERSQVIEALQQTHNHVERAADRLLSQS